MHPRHPPVSHCKSSNLVATPLFQTGYRPIDLDKFFGIRLGQEENTPMPIISCHIRLTRIQVVSQVNENARTSGFGCRRPTLYSSSLSLCKEKRQVNNKCLYVAVFVNKAARPPAPVTDAVLYSVSVVGYSVVQMAALHRLCRGSGKPAAESTELDEGHRTPLSIPPSHRYSQRAGPAAAATKHSALTARPPSRIRNAWRGGDRLAPECNSRSPTWTCVLILATEERHNWVWDGINLEKTFSEWFG